MNDIAVKIKTWRCENGLDQQEFADEIGFSARAIQTWERGQRLPGYDGLLALADYMKVSVDWLMGRA